MKTKAAIVYTSSDSVLQIAAHEDVIPLKELYHMCEIAREITKDEKYKINGLNRVHGGVLVERGGFRICLTEIIV